MSINALTEDVWSKIAAGEVVERPASVVKELVENSLDAGAKRINVKLFDGGRLRIIVEDDGTGIAFDELPLALMYHATSKISNVDDLEHISTLGYRGEALASITAVSDIEIRSRQRDSESGGLIRAHEGKIIEHTQVNYTKGTRVQVENLFSGLPARRKFLKTAAGELRKAASYLREYAVCNPDTAFTLEHDGKNIFTTDGAGGKKRVLAKIWDKGAEIQTVTVSEGNITLECLFQSRAGLSSSKGDVMGFVNGRAVNDPVIKSAVNQAARDLAGNWALFFTLSPSLVDVNVHPAKSEVRFRYPEEIYRALHKAVNNLGSPMFIPEIIHRSAAAYRPTVTRNHPPKPVKHQPEVGRYIDKPQIHFPEPQAEPDIIYMGQNSGGYLIFDNTDGLILIDPHAAHERINYERIKSRVEKSQNVQKLLIPVILAPTLALEAHEYEHELRDAGFELENTTSGVKLNSVPIIGSVEYEPEVLLRASLEELQNHHDPDTRRILWRKWATMACKASVKLTTQLTRIEALALWRDLHECEQPNVCPHGRPTMIEIKNSDLQKRFGRE